MVKAGKSSREIGEALFIDPRTVDTHIDAIRSKLGVRTRVELAVALSESRRGESADEGAARAAKSNLPLQRTPLIGRSSEIADIAATLERNRLVTVTGTGGVGKSRTAIAVGEAFVDAMPSGVWFVELATLAHASLATAIARTLGLEQEPQRPLSDKLSAYLKRRALLLILDNAEHVVAEAATIADELLRACSHLRILVTSREPLRIAGERIYRLPSLRCPAPSETAALTAETAARYASVALFAERARASDFRFALSDENAALVAAICRRLDGIPLAIELAAARVPFFSLPSLAAKLDERFRLLTGGSRTSLPRHRTMRALIDWSYDLLGQRERTLLGRLAVFNGGWTLEAAEAVCSDSSLEVLAIQDTLCELVDKSQVVADRCGTGTRYWLLESVREYALEKMDAEGEFDAVARRHAEWVAALCGQASAALWTLPRRAWLKAIIPELDNARAALSYARAANASTALIGRIAAGLGYFLFHCGLANEGRSVIEPVLFGVIDEAEPEVRGLLWASLSALLTGSRRVEAAEHAIAAFEALGDLRRLGIAYLSIAIAYRQMAQFERCAAAIDGALRLFERTGDERSVYYASALGWRASALIGLSRFDEARELFERDIALLEALADEDRAAVERLNLAELEFAAGNVRRALELAEEATDVLHAGTLETKVRNEHSQVAPYLNIAAYRLILEDLAGALAAAREALVRSLDVEYPLYTAIAIQTFAAIAACRENAALGARLRGFVERIYRAEGVQREPTEKCVDDILLHMLRRSLRDTEIEALGTEGALLLQDAAVRLSASIDGGPIVHAEP